MPLRAPTPGQAHYQLRNEFIALTNQRKDLDPASTAYATKSALIDRVLARVWALGTIYSRSGAGFD